MRVEIWSDLVCPWCYIGKRRFESALASFEHRDQVEVVHRSFQLDPTQSGVEDRDEMLAAKFGLTRERAARMNEEMAARAAQDGLEYNLSGTVVGNTADAHRLIHLGAAEGVQDAVVETLYKAHFTDRRSLFDHGSLVELAVEAGLDGDRAREVLESGKYGAEVAAEHREAQRLGATGVPFFVVDRRYGVSGAQPAQAFTEVLSRAWADSKPLVVTDGGGEACADGTCAT
ncbi:DsbA family oxidoreductase [Spirillospora sp. NPDC047279]|uniref:DsbA family oxidoreductase n=1 Tax=Spirillospora sp. NPDC047279 TaxID=3155478 RepID=UPI0033F2F662